MIGCALIPIVRINNKIVNLVFIFIDFNALTIKENVSCGLRLFFKLCKCHFEHSNHYCDKNRNLIKSYDDEDS